MLILIACLRGDQWLLEYSTASPRRDNIAEPVASALSRIGCSEAGRFPWLWEFLFAEKIFLPIKNSAIHWTLTYQALNGYDEATIPLLEIVKKHNLFMMTTSAFAAVVKECDRIDIMEVVVSSTCLEVIDGSKALKIAGEREKFELM